MTNIKLKKTENKNANKNANKELFDRINKIKKRVRMFIEGNNENEWQNAQSFQLTNLIKLLIAKKKEMTFPFKSKQGNETNDKITITNGRNQTMWSFSYNGKSITNGLWYYNHGLNDIFFSGDITGSQKWKVKPKPNKNEFDLDQGNGIIWKNFKLTSNNIYKSSCPFQDNKLKIGTMTLLPTTCK